MKGVFVLRGACNQYLQKASGCATFLPSFWMAASFPEQVCAEAAEQSSALHKIVRTKRTVFMATYFEGSPQ